jgi:hypothetical protein
MDRIVETIHKFEEDVFGENRIRGRRRVKITFCEPIALCDRLGAFAKDAKATVSDVTVRIETAIRSVLEE